MRIPGLDPRARPPAGAAADLARQRRRRRLAGRRARRRRERRAAGLAVGCRRRLARARGLRRLRRLRARRRPGLARAAARRRAPAYPDLAPFFPCAAACSAPAADLLGIVAVGARDTRPWLDHGAWPPDRFRCTSRRRPVRAPGAEVATTPSCASKATACTRSPSARCTPASSSRGTSASRWSARRCCASRSASATRTRASRSASPSSRRSRRIASPGASPATRPSPTRGPTAWRSSRPPAARFRRAPAWLRALMLERERVANHLGDLGALGNDAALAFGLAQFSRLREDWLRVSKEVFGHRLHDGRRRPGRRRGRCRPRGRRTNRAAVRRHRCVEVKVLRTIYDEHAGLQDRFIGTGTVSPELAAELGLTGLAGRASGQAADLRCDHPWPPYDALPVTMATHRAGDVAARVAVRFDELFESLRLIRAILTRAAGGRASQRTPPARRRERRRRLGRGLARRSVRRARARRRRARPSAAATATTRRGRTGRCSSTR